jgi:hypothetical protein
LGSRLGTTSISAAFNVPKDVVKYKVIDTSKRNICRITYSELDLLFIGNPDSTRQKALKNKSLLSQHTDVSADKMLQDTRMAGSTGRTAALRS